MEIFKEIKGYEDKYFVSNYGNIKNQNGVILKPYKINSGYSCVKLWSSNTSKAFLVHRLVAEYFLDNDELKPNIDHIDCDKNNNLSSNLQWVTQKENVNNYKQLGLDRVGLNHPRCSLSKDDIILIKSMVCKNSKRKEIYPLFKCSRQTIDNVINSKYNYL